MQFIKKFFFLLFFIVFSFQTVYPSKIESIKNLTISEAVSLAIKHNRDIILSTLSRVSDKLGLIEAKDNFNIHSNLSISSEYRREYLKHSNSNDEREYSAKIEANKIYKTGGSITTSYSLIRVSGNFDSNYNSAATISFSQPLLKGFGRRIATASLISAKISDNVSIRNYENSISYIILQTINAFRNLVVAQKQFEIVKRSLRLSEKLIKINKELVSAGKLAEIDLVETKADLISNKIQLLSAKNMLENAQLELIKLLGLNPKIKIKVVPEKLKILKISKKRVVSTTFTNRQDYLNALDSLKLSEISYDVAKNNLLWDLRLNASLSSTGEDKTKVNEAFTEPFTGKNWDFKAGVVLNIPLSKVVLKTSLIRAKNELLSRKIWIKQLKDNIMSDIRNILFQINTAKLQIEQAKALYEVSKKKVDAEIEKYKVGKTNNFQLLSYKNQLVQSEIDLLSSKIKYMNLITLLENKEGILYKKWQNFMPQKIKSLMEN